MTLNRVYAKCMRMQYKRMTVVHTSHDRCVSLHNLMYLHTGLAGPPLSVCLALDPQPLSACARIAVAVPADPQQLRAVLPSQPISVGAARACTAAQHFLIVMFSSRCAMHACGRVIGQKVASRREEQQTVQLLTASPEGGTVVIVHG